jgi:hypothetical protein
MFTEADATAIRTIYERAVRGHRTAPAISWDYRQRQGTGARSNHRRLEAVTVATVLGDPVAPPQGLLAQFSTW